MKTLLIVASALFTTTLLAQDQPATPTPTLHIQADQSIAAISPMFSGMMTEEINHSYDGGLYGELIQNRVFKDDPHHLAHWTLVQASGAGASMNLDTTNHLNDGLKNSLRLDISSAAANSRAGVANDGYWGIPVTPATEYHASFYAKAGTGFADVVTVTIESPDGSQVYARNTVSGLTTDWQKYSVTLKTTGDVKPTAAARFVLSVNAPGTVWFNLVSLFPPTWHDRPNGNRIDLMQMLYDTKPGFLRFPGGNFLEGSSIATRFPWKETLGDLKYRPGHPGCWGYRASDGLGLLEFLEWAEDLGAKPVLAIYAGYSLPPKNELVHPGPDLAPYVSDALDEIQYVTGDTNTTWGARRAADGHPEPFQLEYIEIGNEDWFDPSGTYDARFAQFYDAIKAKYPQLKCISTVGNEQPAAKRVHSRTPDALDEHYYRSAAEFETDSPTRFEKYDRTGPKIFVGEWAAYEDIVPWDARSGKLPPTPNLKAALADAAWMLAMERNSDLVVMQCYAPMLVNVNPGGRQWRPDLIGYEALHSYGSPSYYAIKLLNANRGDTVIHATLNGLPAGPTPPLDYSVTKDTKDGTLYLKVVNITATPQPVNITISGATSVAPTGTAEVLTSNDINDSNTITDPTHVVPVTEPLDKLGLSFTHTFAPHSVTALKIKTQ